MEFDVRQNRYTATSRLTSMDLLYLPANWKNEIGRDDYNGEFILPKYQKIYSAVVYCKYDKETGFYYIGQTTRDNVVRDLEHAEGDGVCSKMINPETTILCNVVGTKKYILNIEKQFITKYSDEYGENCINVIKFKADRQIRLPQINELQNDIIAVPVLRVVGRGYALSGMPRWKTERRAF